MERAHSIMSLLYQLANVETQLLNQALSQQNLTNEQARALNYIRQHPATNQRAVGDYLGRQAASTSNLMKSLLTRELVTREPAPNNDREKQLRLTPAGEQCAQQIEAAFQQVEQQIHQAVPVEQVTPLEKTLTTLLQQLTKED